MWRDEATRTCLAFAGVEPCTTRPCLKVGTLGSNGSYLCLISPHLPPSSSTTLFLKFAPSHRVGPTFTSHHPSPRLITHHDTTATMRLTLTILALATTAYSVSVQLVKNYCPADKYLTLFLNETGSPSLTQEGPFTLPGGKLHLTSTHLSNQSADTDSPSCPGEALLTNITGAGNQLTLTNTPSDIGAPVARFTLGTSTDKGILYWYGPSVAPPTRLDHSVSDLHTHRAISHLSGDPMAGINFNVTSSNPTTPDICQHATG